MAGHARKKSKDKTKDQVNQGLNALIKEFSPDNVYGYREWIPSPNYPAPKVIHHFTGLNCASCGSESIWHYDAPRGMAYCRAHTDMTKVLAQVEVTEETVAKYRRINAYQKWKAEEAHEALD